MTTQVKCFLFSGIFPRALGSASNLRISWHHACFYYRQAHSTGCVQKKKRVFISALFPSMKSTVPDAQIFRVVIFPSTQDAPGIPALQFTSVILLLNTLPTLLTPNSPLFLCWPEDSDERKKSKPSRDSHSTAS